MFRKLPSVFILLMFVFVLDCLPTVLASDAGNNLLSNTTTNGNRWISTNPEDLQPIAGTSWLIIFHLDDFEYADRLVFGGEIFTFEDDTVYLECYDQLGNFWGIVQYGELSSQGGKNGYLISYYVPGETDSDGEFFFWDFIKTNGLETGTFVIEDEFTGESLGPLPNIGIRIHEDVTPFVTPDVTGDDRLGLADVIWSLQSLSGLK
jgi:hypothetical protein